MTDVNHLSELCRRDPKAAAEEILRMSRSDILAFALSAGATLATDVVLDQLRQLEPPVKTYDQIKAEVERLLAPHFPPAEDRPGFSVEWGGHYDGRDRAFVSSNWDSRLFDGNGYMELLLSIQEILKPHFDVALYAMRRRGDYTLVVQTLWND